MSGYPVKRANHEYARGANHPSGTFQREVTEVGAVSENSQTVVLERKSLMEIIACPTCKGTLQLKISEQDKRETIAERLYCPKCSQCYSIEEGIPNLLPPDLGACSVMPDTALDEKEVKKYYIDIERYDWVTDTKYPEKLFHIWREREIVKRVNGHSRGATILDVGCGTGLITRHISGNRIVALDINRWAVKRAKLHISNKVEFIVGDAENLPLASDAFDIVVCTDVLEHLINPDRALKEIHRVMKTGATLIGEVPSKNLVWKFRKYLTTTCPISEPFHHNYSVSELELLLDEFKVINIRPSTFNLELAFTVQKPNPSHKW